MSKKLYFLVGAIIVALVVFWVATNYGKNAPAVQGVQTGAVSQNNQNGADTTALPTDTNNTSNPPADLPPATVTSPQTITVTYTDNGFAPSAVTVNQGDTVIFENKSSSPFWPASNAHPTHTVYDGTSLQQHCANPTSDTFDACRGIPPGGSWPFTFNKTGAWGYHDHLNPGQTGTVTVE